MLRVEGGVGGRGEMVGLHPEREFRSSSRSRSGSCDSGVDADDVQAQQLAAKIHRQQLLISSLESEIASQTPPASTNTSHPNDPPTQRTQEAAVLYLNPSLPMALRELSQFTQPPLISSPSPPPPPAPTALLWDIRPPLQLLPRALPTALLTQPPSVSVTVKVSGNVAVVLDDVAVFGDLQLGVASILGVPVSSQRFYSEGALVVEREGEARQSILATCVPFAELVLRWGGGAVPVDLVDTRVVQPASRHSFAMTPTPPRSVVDDSLTPTAALLTAPITPPLPVISGGTGGTTQMRRVSSVLPLSSFPQASSSSSLCAPQSTPSTGGKKGWLTPTSSVSVGTPSMRGAIRTATHPSFITQESPVLPSERSERSERAREAERKPSSMVQLPPAAVLKKEEEEEEEEEPVAEVEPEPEIFPSECKKVSDEGVDMPAIRRAVPPKQTGLIQTWRMGKATKHPWTHELVAVVTLVKTGHLCCCADIGGCCVRVFQLGKHGKELSAYPFSDVQSLASDAEQLVIGGSGVIRCVTSPDWTTRWELRDTTMWRVLSAGGGALVSGCREGPLRLSNMLEEPTHKKSIMLEESLAEVGWECITIDSPFIVALDGRKKIVVWLTTDLTMSDQQNYLLPVGRKFGSRCFENPGQPQLRSPSGIAACSQLMASKHENTAFVWGALTGRLMVELPISERAVIAIAGTILDGLFLVCDSAHIRVFDLEYLLEASKPGHSSKYTGPAIWEAQCPPGMGEVKSLV